MQYHVLSNTIWHTYEKYGSPCGSRVAPLLAFRPGQLLYPAAYALSWISPPERRLVNVMQVNYRRVSGVLAFIGASQFSVALIVAEALYPGYSVSNNIISDLGVGATAALFNSSVLLLGAMVVGSAYFARRAFGSYLFTVLVGVAGLGVIGVGVFPETVRPTHQIASIIGFIFAGLAAVASVKFQRQPLNYFSVLMGLVSLGAFLLFFNRTYLGLGPGGMERIIVYPVLLWAVGFGAYLMGSSH